MSLVVNKKFLKQYAKSSYMSKMNPQYEGIAKKYYKEKKQHNKVHQLKNKLDQEVAYIERMEKSMQIHLQKQRKQLQFTKEVSSRIASDLRRREWLQQYREESLKNNQKKAQLMKCQSERKIKEARQYLSQNKRSLANLNRNQNERVKQLKMIKRAQQQDMNKSRVSQIYQFKKDVKQHTNKFYQTKNSSSMSNYNKRIQSYKKFSAYDSNKIEELITIKKSLNEKHNKNKDKSAQISQQIQKIKKQTRMQSSLVRSRLNSRSSDKSRVSNRSARHMKSNSEYLPGHM